MRDDIKSVVIDILDSYGGRWPTDITDQVFLAIERHPARSQTYWHLVEDLDEQGKKGQQIVNQYIGRLAKTRSTGLNRGRCYSPRSSLIKSYEKH